ncbi:MAG: response regulator [Proteobacteria bacterium]|nr:response regulator [Pseudomonadota bacterium]
MTQSSVMLVDAEVEFRKQVASILNERGFRVLEVSSSSEAWTAIEGEKQIDLIAVDSLLSGESSIDFISRFAKEHEKTGIVYLFRHARDFETQEQQIRDLGVSLVTCKPMLPEELAHKIRVLLDLENKRPGSLVANWLEPVFPREDQLDTLRSSYMQKIPTLFKQIGDTLVKAQTSRDSTDMLDEAYRLIHAVNGTAGTLGFTEVCSIAQAMEETLKEIARMLQIASAKSLDYADDEALPKYKLSRGRRVASTDLLDGNRTLTTAVLVVDDDSEFLSSVVTMGRDNLIQIYPASTWKEAMDIAESHHLDAAIIDVYLGKEDSGFRIARDLRSMDGLSNLPISFISSDTSIPTRIAAVHAGASQFIDKPLQGVEFAAAVRRLVPLESPDQPRVFVVDDDEDFLKLISKILEAERMKVETLSDSTRILEVISDVRPDLLLLDVVMPEIDGFDVCRVLRSTEQWRDLPILFMTIHSSHEVLLKCFESGGDDYIEKPVLREELLARINIRLDRVKLFKERADRDGLTGLLTRRAFVEQFKMRLSEASRFDNSVSLCLIDIDHFKKINDTYGHLAGDRVLAGFGRLLGSRFRTMDVRGRWGGEEFVVAFYGEEALVAKMIISRAQEELSNMVFRGDHEEKFGISFSAGITSFPESGDTFEELFKVVDKKLYIAKESGRDRIEI